jgi:nitrile hydratase accessory protein
MASEIEAVRRALQTVPGIPCAGEAPVFAEPWQAQAFAMALTLQQRGVFSWNEWADELGTQIKTAIAQGDPDDGTTYYRHWLATLERLVARKGIASPETLDRYYQAWDHAADRTPHGRTIELTPDDFA